MKQLSLFNECSPYDSLSTTTGETWKLYVDGAARNNPGIAGIGIYLEKNEKPVYKQGFYVGLKTNNQAEYLALLCGLFIVIKQMSKDDVVYIVSDSELMIKQLKGEYKVKNVELKKLFSVSSLLLENITYTVCHVLREFNKEADSMANKGIDKKIALPEDFLLFLKSYEITI